MEIMGLSTSPSSGGAYALILNERDGNRRLPIIIGTFEAQAIALELERIKTPRPMTHDLMRNMIKGFGSQVQAVFINDLKDGTFFAQVQLESAGGEFVLDSRPSDAIALAIRFDAPIYVSDDILNEAGIVSEMITESIEPVRTPEPEAEPQPQKSSDHHMQLLEKKLAAAIAKEDYERAALIRDEINNLKA